jgi:hypothetical protein
MLHHRLVLVTLLLAVTSALSAGTRIPENTILVPGAVASASDAKTPLPEGGAIGDGVYANAYFGLSYPLPEGWSQRFQGPPPSESASYVLALLNAPEGAKSPGSILITAQDLFFSLAPAADALDALRHARDTLQPYYSVEREPTMETIGRRTFARFGYQSTDAGLHWQILSTRLRCHVVQFVLTGRDPASLDRLTEQFAKAGLPPDAGASDEPLCLADYATGPNVISKVNPEFLERRFNAVPVRIIIDREGKVRHVHVISGYPEQSEKIVWALQKWRFRPYLRDGQPVEVETGLVFGNAPPRSQPAGANASVANAARE